MYKPVRSVGVFCYCLVLLFIPVAVFAQSEQTKPGSPPVGQPLVSEGDLALSLSSALGVTTTDDEVEAETQLSNRGIMPQNGWIADYPVTPDVLTEVQNSVSAAADANKISISKAEALQKLADVSNEMGLAVRPYTAGASYEPTQASCQNYPNPATINETYTTEGPPVVTYYCPPPDYYYLYTYVPAPFYWSDLWFPGFFILHDFHRVVHHRHRRPHVISNHFNDRRHRAFRVDPRERFRGRTFGGIGVSHRKDFIPTGIPKSERTIFNAPRNVPPGGTAAPPSRRGQGVLPSTHGGERTIPREGGRISVPSGGSMERGGRR